MTVSVASKCKLCAMACRCELLYRRWPRSLHSIYIFIRIHRVRELLWSHKSETTPPFASYSCSGPLEYIPEGDSQDSSGSVSHAPSLCKSLLKVYLLLMQWPPVGNSANRSKVPVFQHGPEMSVSTPELFQLFVPSVTRQVCFKLMQCHKNGCHTCGSQCALEGLASDIFPRVDTQGLCITPRNAFGAC
jgi:hypothetical protein